MRAIELLLLAFDHALQHPWESLAGAVHELQPEEASWQPPAYATLDHDVGVGKPGTVLWYLNHLQHCHRHYTAVLQSRPVTQSPDTPPSGEQPLEEALKAVTQATAGLRAQIALLTDAELDQPCTDKSKVAEFLAGVVRHISWHAGQIATLRRLYRAGK
ncbi:MAG: DinB family protein [Planctomycetes bacterium]|nr:DinB family protein [Planctomycetota bacterium]